MFQKPAFGSNTSGFGSFSASTSSSPFGFKPTASTSAFGAPSAFGAGAQQNAGSTGLFGSSTGTGSTMFGTGSTSTAAPTFGTSGGGFSFGRGRGRGTGTGGVFGANTSTSGLFGTSQPAPAFGTTTPAFGFGAATPTSGTGLFGASAPTNTSLFGQQNTSLSGGGLFSNTTGAFGQQQQQTGTAHVKYTPQVGTDVIVKSGNSQTINIKHHCITCMKEYEGKSLEELRLEDYTAGRKGPAPGTGLFGGFGAQSEAKPLFGTSGFGQPATTSATGGGMFGGGTLTTGTTFGQGNTFSFGGGTTTSGGSTLFGASKPAFGATSATGTGLFGATSTQAPTFGTSTSSFAFGSTAPSQMGGLFGAKPATSGFGATPSTSGFGAAASAPAFGSTASAPAFGSSTFGGGGLFGAKPTQSAAPAFGSTTPAFGSMSGGFGTGTTGTSGSLFGSGSTFGKPTTAQPAFGFGSTQQGVLGGMGTMGGGALQTKPTAGFGLGGGLFQQPQANTFKTDGGGLGGSLFGNTSTFGGSGLGQGGFGANAMQPANTNTPNSSSNNVHEQILTLAARPYGDSPLYKDLSPNASTSNEEVVKPSNPAALKALAGSGASYRVTSPATPRLKLLPRHSLHQDKKSLFDSMDDSDGNIEDKLCLKPTKKRLVLRPNQENGRIDNQKVGTGQYETQTDGPSAERVSQTEDSVQAPNKVREHVHEANIERWNWSRNEELTINRETTPRLYPNLDQELVDAVTERRASRLTTKPLPMARKLLSSNPHSQENSQRDLVVRSDSLEYDKENIGNMSVPEEVVATTPAAPHPAGVKLTRPGYYTIPSLDEMTQYLRADGSCVVPSLTIGRRNYGNVFYDCAIDVAGLDLDSLVHFLNKEVIVYPEDSSKPPVGEGLNRRAVVTLDRVWPRDKTRRAPITDPDRLQKMEYEAKLRRVCDKHDTKFIEYRPETGSWVFRVEHFSSYGLPDSRHDNQSSSEDTLS